MIQLNPYFRRNDAPRLDAWLPRRSHPGIVCCDPLKPAVALLSNVEIDRMSDVDLRDAIRSSNSLRTNLRTNQNDNLDQTQLRRLLYLLRRIFRIELDLALVARGFEPNFNETV